MADKTKLVTEVYWSKSALGALICSEQANKDLFLSAPAKLPSKFSYFIPTRALLTSREDFSSLTNPDLRRALTIHDVATLEPIVAPLVYPSVGHHEPSTARFSIIAINGDLFAVKLVKTGRAETQVFRANSAEIRGVARPIYAGTIFYTSVLFGDSAETHMFKGIIQPYRLPPPALSLKTLHILPPPFAKFPALLSGLGRYMSYMRSNIVDLDIKASNYMVREAPDDYVLVDTDCFLTYDLETRRVHNLAINTSGDVLVSLGTDEWHLAILFAPELLYECHFIQILVVKYITALKLIIDDVGWSRIVDNIEALPTMCGELFTLDGLPDEIRAISHLFADEAEPERYAREGFIYQYETYMMNIFICRSPHAMDAYARTHPTEDVAIVRDNKMSLIAANYGLMRALLNIPALLAELRGDGRPHFNACSGALHHPPTPELIALFNKYLSPFSDPSFTRAPTLNIPMWSDIGAINLTPEILHNKAIDMSNELIMHMRRVIHLYSTIRPTQKADENNKFITKMPPFPDVFWSIAAAADLSARLIAEGGRERRHLIAGGLIIPHPDGDLTFQVPLLFDTLRKVQAWDQLAHISMPITPALIALVAPQAGHGADKEHIIGPDGYVLPRIAAAELDPAQYLLYESYRRFMH